MAEGRRLADLLNLQRGDLNGEQAGLTLAYLETLERIADPEFAEIVLLILERSRHLEVARAASSVSRLLLLDE
jgi:ABC-type branched-subunit amino acid transport system ATPase component